MKTHDVLNIALMYAYVVLDFVILHAPACFKCCVALCSLWWNIMPLGWCINVGLWLALWAHIASSSSCLLFSFAWLLSVVLVVLLHLALLVVVLLAVVEAEVPVLPVLLAAGEGAEVL